MKNDGQHGKICLYLIKRDRVFKLLKIHHIFRFKYAMVWMKVWKKSASMFMCYMLHVPYLYLFVNPYTYTCLNLKIQFKKKLHKIVFKMKTGRQCIYATPIRLHNIMYWLIEWFYRVLRRIGNISALILRLT